jgi:SRSO17 transposase
MGDDLCVAQVQDWADGLAELDALMGARFARSEPRVHAMAYVRGLLSGEERKNSWTLSERAGDATPDGMQRLLSTADWDPDLVRDDLRSYVVANLGDPGGVLVVDETGFLKKGTRSAGVARQYSGTAGRIENCQIGVFLAYATSAGRTFLDRELYVPRAWSEDRERCAAAGIGSEVQFSTKPELAMAMLRRAHGAGVPAGWVSADEVYGQHYRFRVTCEELGYNYVLAVAVNQRVIAGPDRFEGQQFRADDLIAALPAQCWQRRSAGKGSKGERLYDWARVRVHGPEYPDSVYWLMARRSLTDPSDLAYYLCHAPARTSLSDLLRVAGIRWSIEETFQTAKGQTGLDHYQVRQYTGWYRHITLSMLAHAFLTVTRSKKGALNLTTAMSST